MMKRVLTVLIAVVFAMSLAACGNSVEENNTVTDGNGVTAAADGADAVTEAEPEGNTEGETAVPDESGEVPNVTIQDIVNKNYIADLVYNAGTVTLENTLYNNDSSVYGTYNYEFYTLDSGYPAVQLVFTSDEVGSSETMCLAGDGIAAEYDNYVGYTKTLTVIPTMFYEMQVEAFWEMMYPDSYEQVVSVATQDGATVVVTFSYDESYGEDYKRCMYYLDDSGRIVYKEVTRYLVTEGAEIDPETVYGMDEAPVMSVDTYFVSYGEERKLNLTTDKDITEGDTCEFTVHIVDGDLTETQTFNVVHDAFIGVMAADTVYELYADEAMTEIFDMSTLANDTAEAWAKSVNPAVG